MTRMVRKQMYMDEELDRALALRARTMRTSQAELMRRAMQRYLAETEQETREATIARVVAGWDAAVEAGFTMGARMPTRDELHQRVGFHGLKST
jgi:phage gp16-like protein